MKETWKPTCFKKYLVLLWASINLNMRCKVTHTNYNFWDWISPLLQISPVFWSWISINRLQSYNFIQDSLSSPMSLVNRLHICWRFNTSRESLLISRLNSSSHCHAYRIFSWICTHLGPDHTSIAYVRTCSE